MSLVDQFFLRFASYIIITSVLVLHILGYLITLILQGRYNFLVWSSVGAIDMLFGFRCGKLVENFYRRVLHDHLTGVGNRALFYLKFPMDVNKFSPTSILLLDLDNFKNINDTYGHNVGDKVLKEFVSILNRCIGVNDTVIRWGGEEFVIILSDTEEKEAVKFAEKIRIATERAKIYIDSDDIVIRITTSIGVVTCNNKESGNTAILKADKALYKAKEKRNLVITWDDSLGKAL
ncbi:MULTISPECIES: GGDEF domain-containing protein [unclassified Clostridium]|uniref:GGDEF domain-containing protein n=1 Tax=unclassified Clostridium TaxID=2614128 RepID=UPI000297EC4B|nr:MULTISPECIES: GGDEF domain-containing protein [unclassified Clostridium]EKQ56759.1 MAG: diguanylate cyclase (GGDEF) domain-containing protein [Clostridium sp. Maddingley MBC34-26]